MSKTTREGSSEEAARETEREARRGKGRRWLCALRGRQNERHEEGREDAGCARALWVVNISPWWFLSFAIRNPSTMRKSVGVAAASLPHLPTNLSLDVEN